MNERASSCVRAPHVAPLPRRQPVGRHREQRVHVGRGLSPHQSALCVGVCIWRGGATASRTIVFGVVASQPKLAESWAARFEK
jgi:hypothetical protein